MAKQRTTVADLKVEIEFLKAGLAALKMEVEVLKYQIQLRGIAVQPQSIYPPPYIPPPDRTAIPLIPPVIGKELPTHYYQPTRTIDVGKMICP